LYSTKNSFLIKVPTCNKIIRTCCIRGFKWRLEKDGSGALAGDNITWDKDGNMNFKGKNSFLIKVPTCNKIIRTC